MEKKLPEKGFSIDVDQTDAGEWDKALFFFKDATIYQTTSYANVFWGKENITYFVLKKHGRIVAMALGRIAKIPYVKAGAVNFLNAPVWRLSNGEDDNRIFQIMIRELKEEYSVRRGLLLKIRTNEKDCFEESSEALALFLKGGFYRTENPYYCSIRVNLLNELEEIRKNFKGRWRRNLVKAEKKELEIYFGKDRESYYIFRSINDEMFDRKKPEEHFNPEFDNYWKLQEALPEAAQLIFMICKYKGEPVAANIIAGAGDTAMYLLGATSDKMVKENLNAPYLLHWETIKMIKTKGYTWYDLRWYDPERFPGVSRFKSGFSGEVVRFAEFEACDNLFSKMLIPYIESLSLKLGIRRILLERRKDIKEIMSSLFNRK